MRLFHGPGKGISEERQGETHDDRYHSRLGVESSDAMQFADSEEGFDILPQPGDSGALNRYPRKGKSIHLGKAKSLWAVRPAAHLQ